MKTPDLKPCPFCGYDKLKITKKRKGNYYRNGDYVQVICNKCKARGPIVSNDYDAKLSSWGDTHYMVKNKEKTAEAELLAGDAWNTRAPDVMTVCGAYAATIDRMRREGKL